MIAKSKTTDERLRIVSWSILFRLLSKFLPAALVTVIVVLGLYYLERANELALHKQAGTHLVELQQEIIGREMKAVESDLLFLANQAVLRNYLSNNTAKQQLQEEYLLFCKHQTVYDQIRYLDHRGQERIRINHNKGRPIVVPDGELQFKGDRYYFVQTMRLNRDEVFVSPLDLNIEHGQIEKPIKPVIRFAAPVFDSGNNKKGILVLNYRGAGLLEKLAEVSVTFPGSVLLLNRDGEFLRGPAREDEWGFMLGHRRTFSSYYPDEWRRLLEQKSGQLLTPNGLFTYRMVLPREIFTVGRSLSHPHGHRKAAETSESTLIIVSHVPPQVLYAQSTLLLQRLLVLLAVVLLLLFGLAWYLAYAGVLRQRQERQLAESESRLRILSTQLLTAQEDERRRIARDLHDELGQLATAVSLDLQRSAQAGDFVKKDNLIGRALHTTECLLKRIREIAAVIRPTMLDDLGIKDAVQNLLSDFEMRTAIEARADLRFDCADVPVKTAENIYRILQEALSNVSKHAKTQQVFVKLHTDAVRADLTIRDEGVGFSLEGGVTNGLGILGMRERTALLNGAFLLTTRPGEGTSVEVTIPMSGELP